MGEHCFWPEWYHPCCVINHLCRQRRLQNLRPTTTFLVPYKTQLQYRFGLDNSLNSPRCGGIPEDSEQPKGELIYGFLR